MNINTESWLSGRKRFTANEVNCKRFQGFESLTLRKANRKIGLVPVFLFTTGGGNMNSKFMLG